MTPRREPVTASGPAPATPVIRVHIERLVVTGVPVADRRVLAAAVEQRLGELLAGSGGPSGSFTAGRVDGGVIRVGATARDGELGAGIARAVQGALPP